MAQGLTWQQAVQWIEEVPLVSGQRMAITAKHDTYGISFAVAAEGSGSAEASPHSRVPLWVRAPVEHHIAHHIAGPG